MSTSSQKAFRPVDPYPSFIRPTENQEQAARRASMANQETERLLEWPGQDAEFDSRSQKQPLIDAQDNFMQHMESKVKALIDEERFNEPIVYGVTLRNHELSDQMTEIKSEEGSEKLLDNFDENFVDRRAEPLDEEGAGKLCEVCYFEYKPEDFFGLKCQHVFCVNCQADHLRTKITNGMAMKLPCMQQGCKERYTLEQIQQFCSAKIQKTYQVIQDDVRVGKSNKLKWCARPGCENTIRRPGCCCKRRAICQCGFETCWKCGDPMHEAACQVSGEAGLLMHNVNPRVSKCPNCRAPIYKMSGCNHMTCYRCNKDYCWICRTVTSDYSAHFEPGAMFGCAGMQEIPQSIVLWVLLLCVQLLFTPMIVMGNLSYKFGKYFRDCLPISVGLPGFVFFFSLLGVPVLLIPTAIILPFVIAWRIYVIVMILLRHFVFCCCC